MYKKLWNHVNRHVKKSHMPAVFLSLLTVGWSVAGTLLGLLISFEMQKELIVKLTVILCTGGYAGLIFGFFGGIFYLYQINLKHSSDKNKEKETATDSLCYNKTAA